LLHYIPSAGQSSLRLEAFHLAYRPTRDRDLARAAIAPQALALLSEPEPSLKVPTPNGGIVAFSKLYRYLSDCAKEHQTSVILFPEPVKTTCPWTAYLIHRSLTRSIYVSCIRYCHYHSTYQMPPQSFAQRILEKRTTQPSTARARSSPITARTAGSRQVNLDSHVRVPTPKA
jgi:hypothetical protein